jgi:hypothetical protein
MGKQFAWSFSRLKNFETCPKRHYEVDIAKRVKDSTEQLDWGNKVHDALAQAVKHGTALPEDMKHWQKWVNSLKKFAQGGGEILVEQKYALTKDFQPCEWFSPLAWYRGVGDFVGIKPPTALILDYKTGKILIDSKQLMLMAACVFAYHPDVTEVKSGYVWLKEDCMTPETYTRETVRDEWVGLLPRIAAMQRAAETMDYPPTPNRLCYKHCPVISCAFHGKRT